MRLMRPMRLAPLAALGLLLGLIAAPAALGAPRVKLATLAPKGTSFERALLAMGEKWRDAPGGGVQLIIYPNGTMGGEADMVRRMRVGQIQAAMLTVTGLSQIDDSVAALQNMPMIFRSLDELDYVREKLRPMLEKRFRDKGYVVLFWGDAGWVRFFSRQAAIYPDDFKKLKLFTWAGDSRSVELWKAAGFQPVPLEVTDILTGLNTGLIDAVCSAPSYALAGQFYGPAPHMLDLHWAPLVGGTVITDKSFSSLGADTRKAMLESAAEAGALIKERSRAETLESIEAMKKRGLIVHEVTPEIEAIWRKTCEAAYPRIRGSIVPPDMFDEVQKLLDDYRKHVPAESASPSPAGQ